MQRRTHTTARHYLGAFLLSCVMVAGIVSVSFRGESYEAVQAAAPVAPREAQAIASRGEARSATTTTTPVVQKETTQTTTGTAGYFDDPMAPRSCTSRDIPVGTVVMVTNRKTTASTSCEVVSQSLEASDQVIALEATIFGKMAERSEGIADVRLDW